MEQVDKVKIGLNIAFRVLLIYSVIIAAMRGSWVNVLAALSALLLTFLPSLIERKLKVDYPGEFEIIILLFIFASVYLGDMHDFYLKFRWWDTLLHSLSGLIFGVIGFTLVYILNSSQRAPVKLTPVFIAIFAFCFSLSMGILWEIYEFLMDELFGMKLQRFGLNDTMWDMILDTLGAIVVSAAGYLHLKYKAAFLRNLVKRFTGFNPRLFRRPKRQSMQ